MSYFTQRIQSYFATPGKAQEKISDLLIELRHRGMSFDVQQIDEDGEKYFYAKSVNYPRGYISATGRTLPELEAELKDAIFTAFNVPPRYCIPDLISFNPPLTLANSVAETANKIYATT